MNVHAARRDADLVVTVHGHLVVGTRRLLHDTVAPLVAEGVHRVVIDFHDTAYIDSTGLATLAALARLLGERGGSLRSVGMVPDLRAACALAKLDGVVTHHATIDAALAEGASGDRTGIESVGDA